jgi:cell division protein FtsW
VTARTTTIGSPARHQANVSAAKRRHPAAAGRRRPRRPPAGAHFYLIALIVALLTMLGLVMVLSASSVMALAKDGSGFVYFRKQLLWTGLGVLALLFTLKVPLHVWRRLVGVILLLAFALMIAVLVPGVGRQVNGARAWIEIGPIGFQPAELVKLALLVYTADLMARRADRMNEVRNTLGPPLLLLAAFGVLIMMQPDLGSAIVLVAIVLAIAFIGGTPLTPLAGVGMLAGAVGMLFVASTPYRRDRWLAFLDLANRKSDEGFQVWQSLVGIASGGVTGAGLGAAKSKWGYLPEAHTDFIFAILAEELGLVGVVVVCFLFAALGVLGIQVALRCEDRFGMLLAGGVTAWLVVQALINIGGVTGLLPLTGLTLPFLSFGGTSLLVTMAAAGLLLNVARTSR